MGQSPGRHSTSLPAAGAEVKEYCPTFPAAWHASREGLDESSLALNAWDRPLLCQWSHEHGAHTSRGTHPGEIDTLAMRLTFYSLSYCRHTGPCKSCAPDCQSTAQSQTATTHSVPAIHWYCTLRAHREARARYRIAPKNITTATERGGRKDARAGAAWRAVHSMCGCVSKKTRPYNTSSLLSSLSSDLS